MVSLRTHPRREERLNLHSVRSVRRAIREPGGRGDLSIAGAI